jgi:hypothetical protein
MVSPRMPILTNAMDYDVLIVLKSELRGYASSRNSLFKKYCESLRERGEMGIGRILFEKQLLKYSEAGLVELKRRGNSKISVQLTMRGEIAVSASFAEKSSGTQSETWPMLETSFPRWLVVPDVGKLRVGPGSRSYQMKAD